MMASSVEQARALDAADGKIDGYYHGNKVCARPPPPPPAPWTRGCVARPHHPPPALPWTQGEWEGGESTERAFSSHAERAVSALCECQAEADVPPLLSVLSKGPSRIAVCGGRKRPRRWMALLYRLRCRSVCIMAPATA